MRLLLIRPVWGAIVPHAPLLLRSVGTDPALVAVREAFGELGGPEVAAVVILSTHGRESGVYAEARGTLEGFGVEGVDVEARSDAALVERLARAWGVPVLDGPADHGIVVPLRSGSLPDVPVIACTLEEATGPGREFTKRIEEDVKRLVTALTSVDLGPFAFVASAHTSAALSARAPLTHRPEAEILEEQILAALERDAGGIAAIDDSDWRRGDPCGRGALLAFSSLFEGHSARIHAYEHPVGVGYLVASAHIDGGEWRE